MLPCKAGAPIVKEESKRRARRVSGTRKLCLRSLGSILKLCDVIQTQPETSIGIGSEINNCWVRVEEHMASILKCVSSNTVLSWTFFSYPTKNILKILVLLYCTKLHSNFELRVSSLLGQVGLAM